MANQISRSKKGSASLKSWLKKLGPGLITAASDNDPSGIATYSQAGAKFGYGLLWTMLFVYPLVTAIQEISARLGRVTGHGIAGNMRRYYPHWLMYVIVTLLLIANTINLGADIGVMGSTLNLLIGGNALLYSSLFAIAALLLQIFVSYDKYKNLLKGLTLALFTYVATIFVVHVPWAQVLRGTFLPSISFSADYLTTLIAVLGTTISPYLFFWQASEEVEEVEDTPDKKPLKGAPQQARSELNRLRFDTYSGFAFSNTVAFFIILTAAITLHSHGITNIETATQAALALRPVAGKFGFLLFSAGMIGTGLLAVPVLAGSAAYAVGEALQWPIGLERKPLEAKGFYGILAVATLIGLGLNFISINPIKALYWAAVINGVVSVPVMIVMMLMVTNPKVMGRFTLGRRLRLTGWLTTAVMFAAAIGLFATWGK